LSQFALDFQDIVENLEKENAELRAEKKDNLKLQHEKEMLEKDNELLKHKLKEVETENINLKETIARSENIKALERLTRENAKMKDEVDKLKKQPTHSKSYSSDQLP
jgi:predicted RNase H-like nuclease (RuvC/YqgF family)